MLPVVFGALGLMGAAAYGEAAPTPQRRGLRRLFRRRGGPRPEHRGLFRRGGGGKRIEAAIQAANDFGSWARSSGLRPSSFHQWHRIKGRDRRRLQDEYTIFVEPLTKHQAFGPASDEAHRIAKAYGAKVKMTAGDDAGEYVFTFYGGRSRRDLDLDSLPYPYPHQAPQIAAPVAPQASAQPRILRDGSGYVYKQFRDNSVQIIGAPAKAQQAVEISKKSPYRLGHRERVAESVIKMFGPHPAGSVYGLDEEQRGARRDERQEPAKNAANDFVGWANQGGHQPRLRRWHRVSIRQVPPTRQTGDFTIFLDGISSDEAYGPVSKEAHRLAKLHGTKAKVVIGDDEGEYAFTFFGVRKEKGERRRRPSAARESMGRDDSYGSDAFWAGFDFEDEVSEMGDEEFGIDVDFDIARRDLFGADPYITSEALGRANTFSRSDLFDSVEAETALDEDDLFDIMEENAEFGAFWHSKKRRDQLKKKRYTRQLKKREKARRRWGPLAGQWNPLTGPMFVPTHRLEQRYSEYRGVGDPDEMI